jgi:uncharacterized membrane protein YagU involved in acid resistance
MEGEREPEPLKGFAAGLVAGFVATFAMTQFQELWLKATEEIAPEEKHEQQQDERGENANEKVARLIANSVGRELSREQLRRAGTALHYAFGTVMGGVYGVNAELFPRLATAGFGTLHGLGLWLGADEIGLWKMGLAQGPGEVPVKTHVYAAASHVVYGVATEATRRLLRG